MNAPKRRFWPEIASAIGSVARQVDIGIGRAERVPIKFGTELTEKKIKKS